MIPKDSLEDAKKEIKYLKAELREVTLHGLSILQRKNLTPIRLSKASEKVEQLEMDKIELKNRMEADNSTW